MTAQLRTGHALGLVSGAEVSKAIDHFFMQIHRYRTFYFDLLG